MDIKWQKWLKRREQLNRVSAQFLETVKALDPALCDEEEVCGRWPVKGMVSHIVGWETEVVRRFREFLAGSAPDLDYDINEFNRQSVEARRHHTWAEIVKELDSAQTELNETVANVSAEQLLKDKRFQEWMNTMIAHYRYHLRQLKDKFG